MDENTIESSFCFKYLTKFVGLKRSTIESLVANDYDNIHSLMAFDLDIDLNQLPNVSMGQKSILRDALVKLKKEIDTWVKSDLKTESPVGHNVLNSTPNMRAYSFGRGDQLFKDLITTAMMDITGGPHALPLEPNVSHEYSANKTSDSNINGTDSEPLKTRIKRISKSLENTENNQNSKRNISFNKSDNKTKSKKKKKKFRYSLKSSRNQRRNQSNPLSEKSNCERQVFIDIDNNSRIEGQNEEQIVTQVIEQKQTTHKNAIKSKTATKSESKQNNSFRNNITADDLIYWKAKKPEMVRLLKDKSPQIKLKKDKRIAKDIQQHFKAIQFEGKVTPLIVCSLCYDSNDFRVLMPTNSTILRIHLSSKRHQNDPPLKKELKFDAFEDSDLSAEEFDNQLSTPLEAPKPNKSLKELLTKSDPQICVNKISINFDESINRYVAELLDTESQNSSQIIISNYREIFEKESTPKAFKCEIEGCAFSCNYPFSLQQHNITKHNKKSPQTMAANKLIVSATKKKNRSFSVLKGMNSYVSNYMKKKTSTEDSVLSTTALNMSAPAVCQSPDNDTNDEYIDSRIRNKIKYWFKQTLI